MNTKILKYIFVLLFLIFLLYPINMFAQKGIGGEPGSFLNWGQGSRALGLGGAFVGMADDASALWWNPAGLMQLNKMEITTLYASLWEDTYYNFIGYAHPTLNWGSFGVGVVQIDSKNFKERSNIADTPTNFNIVQQAFLLSYGNKFLEKLSAGVSFKMISQKMPSYSDTGLGIDGSLFYRSLDKKLSLGVNLQNLVAPELNLKQTTDKYSFMPKVGGSYTFSPVFRKNKDKLLACFEIDYSSFSQYFTNSLGVEYWMLPSFALRLGKNKNADMSFGFGCVYNNLQIDYSLINHELGLNHNFSLTYRFGYLGEAKYSEEAIKKKINEYYLRGVNYYDAGKYSQALSEWEKALIWNPVDEKIQRKVEEAKEQLEAIVNKKLLEERVDKAYAFYEEGNLIDSLEQWKEVSKLDPANLRAKEYIEKINSVLDKEDKQLYLEREKEKEILTISNYLNKGQEDYVKAKYKEAISEWQKILDIKPEHLQAKRKISQAEDKIKEEIKKHFTTGVEFYNNKQTAEAIRELNLVLSYDDSHKEAQEYLNKAKTEAKQIRKKASPKQINSLYYQSADLYLKGKYEESVNLINQLLELDPANENANKLLDKVQSVMEVLGKK